MGWNPNDHALTVINGNTNSVVTTSGAGWFPDGIALNPRANRAWVANYLSQDLSIIDGTTNTVAATVTTGNFPLGQLDNCAAE